MNMVCPGQVWSKLDRAHEGSRAGNRRNLAKQAIQFGSASGLVRPFDTLLMSCRMISNSPAIKQSGMATREFVGRENIALFRKKLADPTLSDRQRKIIEALLQKELAASS